MKIPNRKVEFQAYKDGICNIYYEDEEGQKTYKYTDLNFNKRVLGFNRHYAAKAVQVQTDMVIRIPLVSNINNHDLLNIKGVGKFSIELVQDKFECNPPSLDLTLRQLEVHE
ncbi:hypothetical protein FDA33_06025 [Clostridium botulinum]|nr:hypothetical protein [Clostridium botulinum]NFI18285.1 hypothetical protein [Clostridium botulinum]NFL93831.1 hypothetical protein [Clostridium botulinum]NFN50918.1 hypothetical protein [Clostridium botulinum]NFO28361.1 hypothetical protein [Clostridium botulinum]